MTKEAKKVKVEFCPDTHGERLAELIKSASDTKLKIEGYSDEVKELRTTAKDEIGVDGKMFNQLLAIYHKGTRERFEDEKTEVVDLYDTVFDK